MVLRGRGQLLHRFLRKYNVSVLSFDPGPVIMLLAETKQMV